MIRTIAEIGYGIALAIPYAYFESAYVGVVRLNRYEETSLHYVEPQVPKDKLKNHPSNHSSEVYEPGIRRWKKVPVAQVV